MGFGPTNKRPPAASKSIARVPFAARRTQASVKSDAEHADVRATEICCAMLASCKPRIT